MSALREALDAHYTTTNAPGTDWCSCGWRPTAPMRSRNPWADHREQAVRAALASERTLDDAWRDAEAALPDGWTRLTLQRGTDDGQDIHRWFAIAEKPEAGAAPNATEFRLGVSTSKVAALDALTAKLRAGDWS